MYLPNHYGNAPHVIRNGMVTGLGFSLKDELLKIQQITSQSEKQLEEAEKTQELVQIASIAGTMILGLVGIYLVLKISKEAQK